MPADPTRPSEVGFFRTDQGGRYKVSGRGTADRSDGPLPDAPHRLEGLNTGVERLSTVRLTGQRVRRGPPDVGNGVRAVWAVAAEGDEPEQHIAGWFHASALPLGMDVSDIDMHDDPLPAPDDAPFGPAAEHEEELSL